MGTATPIGIVIDERDITLDYSGTRLKAARTAVANDNNALAKRP